MYGRLSRSCALLPCAVVLFAACDQGEAAEQSPPAAEKKQGPSDGADSEAPASQRMLGHWRMDVAQVPDSALSKDLLEVKRKGMADKLRIEYTITDTEFIMDRWGPVGRARDRWFYEILSENGDALMLERTDQNGLKQKLPATVDGDEFRFGTGNGVVPLKRIE